MSQVEPPQFVQVPQSFLTDIEASATAEHLNRIESIFDSLEEDFNTLGDDEDFGGPCPVCGECTACGYDTEGRALIHALGAEDDE